MVSLGLMVSSEASSVCGLLGFSSSKSSTKKEEVVFGMMFSSGVLEVVWVAALVVTDALGYGIKVAAMVLGDGPG